MENMNELNELKQLEITGRALEEMIRDHDEKPESIKEENVLGKHLTRILGEALIKECGPMTGEPRDLWPGCPKRVMKLQKLLNLINRLLIDYKESFRAPYTGEEEYDDSDLKEMMASSVKLIIGAALGKIQAIWNEKDEEEPKEISADPHEGEMEIQIVPQDEVTSPAGDIYTVNEVVGDSVQLTKKLSNEIFNVNVETYKKWKKN